jgi:Tol biopolymer transport system component
MLEAGTQLGAYTILGPIGAGAMGEVYRARDARLRREVAIKVLPAAFGTDPERLERFEREAHVLASLNHPHIAAIYGFEEAGGVRALVLELVDGATLAERLRRGPLAIPEARAIASQIVDALDAAHERGIVHRDLKPANVKITQEGTVKVLDFGLAKSAILDVDSPLVSTATQGLTREGSLVGTPAYMSPEQARGRSLDKRTDIWSFGCVLYELLTGRRAFARETLSDTIAAILEREPDWNALPVATPPGVRRLLRRCLEKDLKWRLRDIADARVDLDDPLPTGAPESAAKAGIARLSAPLVAAALIAALATAIVFGLVVWKQRAAQTPRSATASTVPAQLTSYGGTEAGGTLSPDGKSFVFVSDHGGTPDIWLRQVAGGEPVRLTNDAAEEADLAYASDGETIYFTRFDAGTPAIWRVGALGGQARKVISGVRAPAPSHDGQLAYYGSVKGYYTLSISGVDGSATRLLAQNLLGVEQSSPAWSPDGLRIAYKNGGLFEPRNLWVVEVGTGRSRQVTRFTLGNEGISSMVWLSDSRHMVVSYVPMARQQAAEDLGILDTIDGSVERLTMNVTDGLLNPSLSSDGSRLIATARRFSRELWKVPLGSDPDANGRAAVRVLDNSYDPMWTFVSRDGRTLLYNNSNVGSRNLWTMPLDRTAPPRQVTTIPGATVSHSSLSPDGTRVAFASTAAGNSDIWTQNVDGSDLRQLTNDRAADSWPVWSPDGQWIVFASLRGGSWETRRIPSAGGASEKLFDGFFRGDWIPQPSGSGTWIVTSAAGIVVGPSSGIRLLDVERRAVLWEDPRPGGGLSLPVFSPDGRSISLPLQESRDRDAIWIYDTATGKARLGARFAQPFRIFFRANWVDGGKAVVVNRYQNISHIVLFDRFWSARR